MNIAFRLNEFASIQPDKKAIVHPIYNKKVDQYHYQSLSFKELDILSNKFAQSLVNLGLSKGDKALIFLRPSLDYSALIFALFKVGIIPVFLDPGMGKKNLLKCIKDTAPKALIAESEVHYLKFLHPIIFKTVKFNVTTGQLIFGKMTSFKKMKQEKIQIFKAENMNPDDTAAILFTSGGTGTPKGVVYTQELFNQQTIMLKNLFNLNEFEIDLPGFPLFSLFTISMGMTSCIPDMDPSKPGLCDPSKLYKNIRDQKPTFVAGSPAIWERVADYCIENSLTLPSIKYVVMFGAPVSTKIHRKFKNILPNGTTYTPYGATEALPISNISGEYILKNTAQLSEEGRGTCIGNPVEGVEIKIIKVKEQSIEYFDENLELKAYEIGEIIVKGKIVSGQYMSLPEKTKESKIYEESGAFWHRMGDLGYLDKEGLLWFCGRKSHLVVTRNQQLYPISCEAIFNNHPAVKRSALVGIGPKGDQTPVIVIERKDQLYLSGKSRSIFESELFSLARKFPHTQSINKIYLSKSLPVDIRHNIKIDRLKLKEEIENNEIN